MLDALRSGIPWRDLPPCYGRWNDVYQRCERNANRGVWLSVLVELQKKAYRTRVRVTRVRAGKPRVADLTPAWAEEPWR
jgi:transposase